MTHVINILGAPGAGKSILAMDLCSLLRKGYAHVELITEAAKDHIYEGKKSGELDQLAVFNDQYQRVKRLNGKVDLIITDSPLFLSPFYAKKNGYHGSFTKYALDVAKEFRNVNFFIQRSHAYDPNGRSQNEQESDMIHEELKDFVYVNGIHYHNVIAGDGTPMLVKQKLLAEGILKC